MGFPHAGGAIPCCFFKFLCSDCGEFFFSCVVCVQAQGSIGYLTSQGETTCREKDALGKLLETER